MNTIPRRDALRSTAIELIENGAWPLRLHARKKKPIGDAWGTKRAEPEEFAEHDNIGIKVGESSSRVDVDLDCPEALAIAPHLMPHTGSVHGRASARRSHLWYGATGESPCEQFQDPMRIGAGKEKAMLVEFRGGKADEQRQTMIPPSIHPTGEILEWDARDAAASVPLTDLLTATRRLAAACLLARYWPGSRHFASLALCGALARAGWQATDVARFVTAIAACVNKDDGEPDKRTKQAADSVAALVAGDHVTGIPTLIELGIPDKVIAKVRAWLELPNAAMGENAAKSARAENGVLLFDTDEKGSIYKSPKNIRIALQRLGVVAAFDQFAQREVIQGLSGFGPSLDDAAMNRLRMLVDSEFRFRTAKDLFYDVVADDARLHSFHPVREYLDSLKWDGWPRISTWLSVYGGAAHNELTQAISRIVLIAAVRRVRQPGCKFDEMLVLEGVQGAAKSTAVETLAGNPDWFTDDLRLGGDTRSQMEAMQGKWIVEAGELKGMTKGDVAALKAFQSRRVDEARMAYGRKPTTMPRQCVIIGTTNETTGYLKDSTGNRRIWPVRVKSFDIGKLRADRDQLWAEAAAAEANGESIRLDPNLYTAAAVEQNSRRVDDPLLIVLDQALGKLTGKIRITDCYRICDLEPGTANQDQITRIGSAMRELGWDRKQRRYGEGPEWSYVKGDETEREVPLVIDRARLDDPWRVTRNARNGGST